MSYQTKPYCEWVDHEVTDLELKKVLDGLTEESRRASTREEHQAIQDRYCEAVDRYSARLVRK